MIAETMAMSLLSLDIPLVPGTKLCPRCWSGIDCTLNDPKGYEDKHSLENIYSPDLSLSGVDQEDLDLELTQVYCYKLTANEY